jgi:hypothetical protein
MGESGRGRIYDTTAQLFTTENFALFFIPAAVSID